MMAGLNSRIHQFPAANVGSLVLFRPESVSFIIELYTRQNRTIIADDHRMEHTSIVVNSPNSAPESRLEAPYAVEEEIALERPSRYMLSNLCFHNGKEEVIQRYQRRPFDCWFLRKFAMIQNERRWKGGTTEGRRAEGFSQAICEPNGGYVRSE
jgi:hypothetical protein